MGMGIEAWAARVPCQPAARKGRADFERRRPRGQGCCVFGTKHLANHGAQMRNLPALWACEKHGRHKYLDYTTVTLTLTEEFVRSEKEAWERCVCCVTREAGFQEMGTPQPVAVRPVSCPGLLQ